MSEMKKFPISKELINAAINESNCAIVDAFREFHQSGDEEISNNAEQLLNAADFFQKLSSEQANEIDTLIEQVRQLREALCGIQSMCIGEIAMGHKLDAQSIGLMITEATGMTNPELNEKINETKVN